MQSSASPRRISSIAISRSPASVVTVQTADEYDCAYKCRRADDEQPIANDCPERFACFRTAEVIDLGCVETAKTNANTYDIDCVAVDDTSCADDRLGECRRAGEHDGEHCACDRFALHRIGPLMTWSGGEGRSCSGSFGLRFKSCERRGGHSFAGPFQDTHHVVLPAARFSDLRRKIQWRGTQLTPRVPRRRRGATVLWSDVWTVVLWPLTLFAIPSKWRRNSFSTRRRALLSTWPTLIKPVLSAPLRTSLSISAAGKAVNCRVPAFSFSSAFTRS